jgi:A/G-specific adenine glycosylase
MAFAHKKRSLVLDVNIRRLFSRALDGEQFPPLHITNHERESRTALIPTNAHTWAAATMELGALVCTATKPLCEKCPIANQCHWRAKGCPPSEIKKKPTQKWEGTDRKCRGELLSLLIKGENISSHSLDSICASREQFQRCINSLLADGLIEKSKGRYLLTGS